MTPILFLLFFLFTQSLNIELASPYGTIQGSFYMTEGQSFTVTKENKQYSLALNFEEIEAVLDLIINANIAQPSIDLFKFNNEKYKSNVDYFVNPDKTDKHLIIMEKNTAKSTTENCLEQGGKTVNIVDEETLITVTNLGNAQNELSRDNPKSLPIQNYNEFWQHIETDPTGTLIFSNTRKPLPKQLNGKPTIITLTDLEPKTRCAYFSNTENTFSTAACNDNLVQKYNVCQHDMNENELLALASHINTYKEQKSTAKIIKTLLLKTASTIETSPLSKINKINVDILTRYQKKMAKNLATVDKSLNPKGLNIFIQHQKDILHRFSALYMSMKNQDLSRISKFFSTNTDRSEDKLQLDTLMTEHIISSKFSKTDKELQITVMTGTDATIMKSAELRPLVINQQHPSLGGQVLLTENECYQNSCLGNPCFLKQPMTSPCCLKHILNKNFECRNVPTHPIQYLAKIKENEFLLVSSMPVLIQSSTCPNVKTSAQGSYLIAIDIEEVGCDLYIDDLKLPVKGAIAVQKYLNEKKRISTSIINIGQDTTSRQNNSNINPIFNLTHTESIKEYILPIAVILGALATILGTSITTYLFVKKRDLNDTEERRHNVPEIFPLQPISSVRPIIRTIRFNERSVPPLSTDSDSSTSD